MTIRQIGIVIPAHNEAEHITACLTAVKLAIAQLPPNVTASVLVVLDSCDDDSEQRVKLQGIPAINCAFRCVGKVRDLGIRHLIEQGVEWVACTDADSRVEPDWLIRQLSHIEQDRAEMICGVVSVDSWEHLSPVTREKYLAHYQDRMGHRHIHGANLSFSATAYTQVGGFDAIACHEDVELVKKFEAHGFNIVWSNQVRVMTSSRLEAKTQGGFGSFLGNLEAHS